MTSGQNVKTPTVNNISCGSRPLPKPRLQRRVCRTLARPAQPAFKILNLDDMGDLGITDLNGDGSQSLSDVANPIVTVNHCDSLSNCFVESFGRHVERMRGAVQIVDNHGAGFERHQANLSYSLFVRPVDIQPPDKKAFCPQSCVCGSSVGVFSAEYVQGFASPSLRRFLGKRRGIETFRKRVALPAWLGEFVLKARRRYR